MFIYTTEVQAGQIIKYQVRGREYHVVTVTEEGALLFGEKGDIQLIPLEGTCEIVSGIPQVRAMENTESGVSHILLGNGRTVCGQRWNKGGGREVSYVNCKNCRKNG